MTKKILPHPAFERTAAEAPPEILDTTPQAIGEALLAASADKILIVRARAGASGWPGGKYAEHGEACAYWLHDSGRWLRGGEPWREAVGEVLDEFEATARATIGHPKSLAVSLRDIRAAKRSAALPELVRLNLRGVALRRGGFEALTECYADQLDSELRFLGCENGVADLRTGKLLPPDEGRRKLVSHSTGCEFDPDAEHETVARLFEHVGETERRWLLSALGHALHGRPSRRLYLLVGPPGGGKSTLRAALVGCLGEYATEPLDSALSESGAQGSHTAGLEQFSQPARLAIMDEPNPPRNRLSPALVKRLSGDGTYTYRRLRENPRRGTATATLTVIANPASVPRLSLEDEAMADRLRELRYPAVPERDPAVAEAVQSPEFKRAFLARLVAEAAKVKPGHPPDDVPTVSAATRERIADDVGEFGAFAERLRPDAGASTAVAVCWSAWCDLHDADPEAKTAGGVSRAAFTRRLRQTVPGLPSPKSIKLAGKVMRGWRGWRLLDAAPSESGAAKPGEWKPQVKALHNLLSDDPDKLVSEHGWPPEWAEHACGVVLSFEREKRQKSEDEPAQPGPLLPERCEPVFWQRKEQRGQWREASYLADPDRYRRHRALRLVQGCANGTPAADAMRTWTFQDGRRAVVGNLLVGPPDADVLAWLADAAAAGEAADPARRDFVALTAIQRAAAAWADAQDRAARQETLPDGR